MAVIAISELRGVYRGREDWAGVDTASRQWGVNVDSDFTSIGLIHAAQEFLNSPVPAFGDLLEDDSLIVARTFSAVEGDDKNWIITVDYAPRDPDEMLDPNDPSGPDVLPELRPAQISFGINEYFVQEGEDAFGVAYVNSVGDVFDNPPMVSKPSIVLTVTQYQIAFSPVFLLDYVGAINKLGYLGAPPRTLIFRPTSAVREYTQPVRDEETGLITPGRFLWLVTYGFEYRKGGWNPVKVVNRGPNVVIEGENDDEPQLHRDAKKVLTGRIVRINNVGLALGPNDETVFLEFNPFEEIDFAGLDIRLQL